jgi:hypothetical protein
VELLIFLIVQIKKPKYLYSGFLFYGTGRLHHRWSWICGSFFAHQLIKEKKSFKIFYDDNISASQVSAGVCNPVILKRFNTFWKSQEQIDYLNVIFKEIEAYTFKKLFD